MGTFINIGNTGFQRIRRSEYIDKSGLISVVNSTLFTEQCFSCVTRCRRFGKSMAAKMLCAYYDHSCDSRSLFADLAIAQDPSFEEHLNKYAVIYLDMTEFVTRFHDDDIVGEIDATLKADVLEAYPSVSVKDDDDLMGCLIRIMEATGEQFVFIIDEWDAICREFKADTMAMDRYVNWLRRMFKGVNASRVFAGVYMTGILPIKKYKTESALNNFIEYSMVDPGDMARFFGFTKDEMKTLAEKHGADFDELEKWYDGYQIGDELSMFNPNSVMQAIKKKQSRSYWASTGAFDAVANYIQMNFEGLKDDIIRMLAGGRSQVNPTGFQNDMSIVRTRDDVLTVLIHLGYLAYDWKEEECYIPNKEVSGEMENAVKTTNWLPVINALQQSKQLLQDTLDGNCEAVARGVDVAHDNQTSILSYNNENSLACVLNIAYYYARNDYIIHRELTNEARAEGKLAFTMPCKEEEGKSQLASGKGFADLVFIPRKHVDKPAMVVELKYDKDANTAISQIKHKQYPKKLAEYTGNLLLVGITYDKKQKLHECFIESMQQSE